MHIHCELVILILALTLNEHVNTRKIIGGRFAEENGRPYMVLVERTTPDGIKYCGGFLLSTTFVMTAAHCSASSYRVFVGLHNFFNQRNVQVIPVEKFIPHKDYHQGQGYRNDIMLLKLSAEANLGQSVPLAGLGDIPSESCIVAGWGLYDDTGRMSPILKEASVKLNDQTSCINEYFYCTDGEDKAAQGDSGGPLVCEDGKAYGVLSYFLGKGHIPDTRIYASIPMARDWIDSTMTSN